MKRGSPFSSDKPSTPFKIRRVDDPDGGELQSTPLGKTKFQGDLPLSPIRSRLSNSQSLSLSRDMTADVEILSLEEQVQNLKTTLDKTKTALDKANARCNELESNTWGTKKSLSEMEITNSRKQSYLEEKVIRLESDVERSKLLVEQEKNRADQKESATEGLRVKLEEITQARKQDQENHLAEIAQWKERVNEYEGNMRTKEAEYDEELDALDEDFDKVKGSERKLRAKIKALLATRAELYEQIGLLEGQNDRVAGVEEELQEELLEANAKIRELTARAQDVRDSGSVAMDALISDVTELSRRRLEVENLQIEVDSLRQWKKEHLEIEEKYLAAKSTVARFEIRVEEMGARQEECEEAKQKWEELESALNKSENITVSDVVTRCSDMRQQIVSLEQKNKQLEEENNRMKRSLDLSSNQAMVIEENISLHNKIERLQAEVDLLSASRKETRELFGSISTEKGLEEAVVDCILGSFDSIAQKSDALFQEKMDVLLKEKTAVESELASCQKTMKEMGQRIETLEGRVNKGEFNPATTKALHLTINPSNTANTRELLMKLRESEDSSSSSRQLSSSTTQGSEKLGENAQVKAILRRMKTKHDSELDLMKRKFRQKISEFRMAVYWVFGWRFDAESETGPKKRRYRLRSMFSTDGDVLVLEVGESGSLELLESEFGKRMLEGSPGEILREFGSIPAFLSQIILDLK